MTEIIQIRNLTKYYDETCALNDISLSIHKGELYGILGPNGAGKTTLIRLLVKLIKPDSGSINLNLGNGNKQSIQQIFGVCPQEIVVWGRLTCLEQLIFTGRMYGMTSSKARIKSEEILEKIGLLDKRNKLASTLSGGMKRRLNFGLGLVHDPRILILDEPEAGLDPQSRILIREYIQELAKDKTIIFSTHNMDEADRLADRIAILDRGQILAIAAPDELKASIGEGDVLEIKIRESVLKNGSFNQLFNSKVDRYKIQQTGSGLLIRGLNLVQELTEIIKILKEANIEPAEIKLRENTLEDVFIELTGRGLRE